MLAGIIADIRGDGGVATVSDGLLHQIGSLGCSHDRYIRWGSNWLYEYEDTKRMAYKMGPKTNGVTSPGASWYLVASC